VREKSQSLREFQADERLRPTELRRTLYLQPLGRYPEAGILAGDLPSLPLIEEGLVTFVFAPPPEELRDFIALFYGLPTEVRDEIDLASLVPGPARVRRHHGQFNAHRMLRALGARLPEDAFSMTALMVRDLYAEEAQEYAFGHAIHEDRVAVASFVQLDPQFIGHARRDDFRLRLRERAYKLVAHEVGHTLGMEHCDEFRCVMNGVADVGELDEAPLHLGPQCLEKFLWLVDVAPAARYAELSEHYQRHGLESSARWARLRARRLR
jgi:predicted Zn-dependent protease